MILKPAPTTPITALKIAELLEECGLPSGWINVVTGSQPEVGAQLVAHDGVDLVSFTGSAPVGQAIRQSAGLKPVLLELGSNAANIVHGDANVLQAAVLAHKAFAYAGQVCISVQRVLVQESIYDRFVDGFRDATSRLVVGNPEAEDTDIGPMIDANAAKRATHCWLANPFNPQTAIWATAANLAYNYQHFGSWQASLTQYAGNTKYYAKVESTAQQISQCG